MTDEGNVRDRLSRLPPIRRARLWRLYAEDGRRFLDFWMDGGRCILGAKGRVIGTVAKASVDVGLTRPFPSIHQARLEKELLKRYPGYAAVRFYREEGRAVTDASPFLRPGESLPLLRLFASYLVAAEPSATPRVAMPRLPCSASFAPAVLLFKDAEDARAASGDLVAPLVLACAHRALFEFDRFLEDYTEALWRKVDRRLKPYFERHGPYLFPRLGGDSTAGSGYDRLFDAALGAGVLLSPDPELPSIIPADFDDGELAKLAAALAAAPSERA